jgi:D-ribose pyranose/furanose isomerase RbsD
MAAALDDRQYKKVESAKEVKRKLKKTEKDAVRELRKDTVQIQLQKNKEQQWRMQNFKKSIIRAGNVKDDV